MPETYAVATLGAGCFWCVEAVFQQLRGVQKVVPGYAGGAIEHPTYKDVCTGTTGHAEAVQITFDPAVISFADLLYVFWRVHDPTTLNRQGADIGPQYRSVIFYHDDAQKAAAEHSKQAADAANVWPHPIVTEISPFRNFYPAEPYHHNYYQINPNKPYCRFVIDPKIQKFQHTFQDKLRKETA